MRFSVSKVPEYSDRRTLHVHRVACAAACSLWPCQRRERVRVRVHSRARPQAAHRRVCLCAEGPDPAARTRGGLPSRLPASHRPHTSVATVRLHVQHRRWEPLSLSGVWSLCLSSDTSMSVSVRVGER